ncbi:CDP-glycerol glycerophosphotransferase family protein, partial [Enterococcus sp. 3C8_DIV0646]|uniref:CDP-glycerol glycerophosphotransferase family protein n=1 Tax=Enterococcus sp. 3C8_DIV0646 TaxID=1834175 RepID=UPI0020CE9DF2
MLVKVHPFIYNEIKNDSRLFGLLISDLIDANEVLSIIDVLITDYSSIFFDFLVTKKPIIFYAWDKDLYSFERGMYLTNDELPGPTAENFDELLKLIQSVEVNHTKYQKKYEELAQRMVP